MKRLLSMTLTTLLLLTLTTFSTALAKNGATRVENAIWAHGTIYSTVVTPTAFSMPPLHSTDTLYSFMMSGLMGQRSVSESAPGDRNYNGGRWAVQMIVFTPEGKLAHDPDGNEIVNFELTSVEEVLHHQSLGHLDIIPTQIYFECPLLRAKPE